MDTIKTSKANVNLFKWLMKARTKEDRPALLAISATDDRIEAVDGHRLHAIERIIKDELPNGVYDVNVTGDLVITKKMDVCFPDTTKLGFKKSTVRLAINPKLLAEALTGFSEVAQIYICTDYLADEKTISQPIKIVGNAADGTAICAVIMPIRNQEPFEIEWNPYK